ncbi:tryptophan 7-halogenase [Microbulbifer celer]|uniref:Tryptophan 7-halogenase n=1 Tax=Microbulbifer celer TaxID=435905 RepID=A0ABW3UD90_9GAMM
MAPNGDTVFGVKATGFRALLMEQILNCGFEGWNPWLSTDRACAAQSTQVGPARPIIGVIIHRLGWAVRSSGWISAAVARLHPVCSGADAGTPGFCCTVLCCEHTAA